MADENAIRAAKSEFDRDGFAVIRGFYTPQEVQGLFERIERYIAEIVPTLPDEFVFYEDKQKPETMFRLEQISKHDPFFEDMRKDERYTGLASTLLDDAVVPQQAEVFAKAPLIGKPTPPHQDGNYFRLVPNEALTFWLPIDSVDEGNGCVRYVRGSHLCGMRRHELSNVFGFSLGITDYGSEDEKKEVAVCVEPGDAIIHHGMTIHRTDANPSDRLRRAIGLVYYAKRARADEVAMKQHHAKVMEEWKKDGAL